MEAFNIAAYIKNEVEQEVEEYKPQIPALQITRFDESSKLHESHRTNAAPQSTTVILDDGSDAHPSCPQTEKRRPAAFDEPEILNSEDGRTSRKRSALIAEAGVTEENLNILQEVSSCAHERTEKKNSTGSH